MFSILIDLLVGGVIGLTLGLLGGGGSILTVPALVYIIGQTPQVAVTASLVIVGANSLLGAFFHRAQGTLNWRVALVFGGVGMDGGVGGENGAAVGFAVAGKNGDAFAFDRCPAPTAELRNTETAVSLNLPHHCSQRVYVGC